MTDKMRWICGDTNPVKAAVDSTTVIEIGDLLWQDTDDAKPASEMEMETHASARRPDSISSIPSPAAGPLPSELFAQKFLGVAMQRSREGDTAPVRVSTTGVFEFGCPSGTFELGELIGASVRSYPAPDPDWDYSRHVRPEQKLLNDTVAKVTDSAYAIARVAKFEHKPVVSVLIDIRSTVMGYGVK